MQRDGVIDTGGAEGQVECRHQHDAATDSEQSRDQPARSACSDECGDDGQPACVRFHQFTFIVENRSRYAGS